MSRVWISSQILLCLRSSWCRWNVLVENQPQAVNMTLGPRKIDLNIQKIDSFKALNNTKILYCVELSLPCLYFVVRFRDTKVQRQLILYLSNPASINTTCCGCISYYKGTLQSYAHGGRDSGIRFVWFWMCFTIRGQDVTCNA